jgi:hypothetical protein
MKINRIFKNLKLIFFTNFLFKFPSDLLYQPVLFNLTILDWQLMKIHYHFLKVKTDGALLQYFGVLPANKFCRLMHIRTKPHELSVLYSFKSPIRDFINRNIRIIVFLREQIKWLSDPNRHDKWYNHQTTSSIEKLNIVDNCCLVDRSTRKRIFQIFEKNFSNWSY